MACPLSNHRLVGKVNEHLLRLEIMMMMMMTIMGTATLKPTGAKVVWTRGTNNRLALEERRECAGMW